MADSSNHVWLTERAVFELHAGREPKKKWNTVHQIAYSQGVTGNPALAFVRWVSMTDGTNGILAI
jgi:hypothetical protein